MAKAKTRAEKKVAYLTKKEGTRQAHFPEEEAHERGKKGTKASRLSKKSK